MPMCSPVELEGACGPRYGLIIQGHVNILRDVVSLELHKAIAHGGILEFIFDQFHLGNRGDLGKIIKWRIAYPLK